jgi:dephospho-CoA kinase
MIVMGLTGSIGMGKSTAGGMLEHLGVPVHDADACVHGLLRNDSPAWRAFTAAFPYYSYPQIYGAVWWQVLMRPFKKAQILRGVNRGALGALVFRDDELRARLEGVLHPFVQEAQQDFIRAQARLGRSIVALDIPLLYETGAERRVDVVANVSAPAFVQRERVLQRKGMTDEKLDAILARQMPDGEKCARADYVVHSGLGRAQMMREIKSVLQDLRAQQKDEVAA